MNMPALTSERVSDNEFEAVYEEYFHLLAQIAVFKFQVPDCDAETLVHDVLLSYLLKSHEIADLHRWLVGAICHASRHYWRLNGRTSAGGPYDERDRVDPASLRIVDTLPNQMAARQALGRLRPRYREILYMRYYEGCTVAEVAVRLGVKPKSAQKLITKCLRHAKNLCARKERSS